jgi:rare lipoprotein A
LRGDTNMCARSLYGGRKASQLFVVALTAVTLAACAQSTVVTNKTASLATNRQTSSGPNRTASFVTNRHVPFATNKHATGTSDAKYGIASFYTEGSETASGEKFDGRKLTAAHPTLPFGTRVRVTNITNGQSVTVRINDRGPFVSGRVVDVSYSAAETLGMTERGVAKVKLEVVQ